MLLQTMLFLGQGDVKTIENVTLWKESISDVAVNQN